MIINDFVQMQLVDKEILAYKTKINILENKNTIIPHEEIKKNNYITKDIISNSLIVLGVIFQSVGKEIICKDEMFILDGHHRFQFILENSLSEYFDVVLLDLNNIKIESYNSELLIDKDIFLEKIDSENILTDSLKSDFFIQVDEEKYYMENITNINDVSNNHIGFESDYNQVKIITKKGDIFTTEIDNKKNIASVIMNKVKTILN